MKKIFDYLFIKFLSEESKNRIEATILMVAIASFMIHLIVIFLVDFKLIVLDDKANLFINPIAAIYTPFSFILVYEVYLLIYYLPRSITVYIGKQYEIMTLILIRKLFKDLSGLKLTPDWFAVKGDMVFTYDLISTVVLFFLIYVFYSLNPQKEETAKTKPEISVGTSTFIRMKNYIATLLVPVFVFMASYSLFVWVDSTFFASDAALGKASHVDGIFFEQFFTILILADVLLLLFSFLRTDRFSIVIRNSGFVISTILIKISFGTEGLLNSVLIVVAVVFGVTILAIQKRYDRLGFNS
ncbi:MAG: hypothetical protein H7328_04050 [Bdellovibrio sp.]|nr:hypothetical protein [Bdellovibrio sp.]